MKTKVIVSGGNADEPNNMNGEFFGEIIKDFKKTDLKVLLVLFAKPINEWPLKSSMIINQFERAINNANVTNISYSIANHENLNEQIKAADVIYVRGGNTLMLLEAMNKHPDFIESIKGKTIAGESAGTYLLSTYFYSKQIGYVREGIGLIPVKAICHFEGRNEDKFDEYYSGVDTPYNLDPSLEKLLLKDFEYKSYYLDSF